MCIDRWCEFGGDEAVDALSMHEIGADQSGESERAFDRFLVGLGEAQQQVCDERHGDLDAYGVLGGART